jgi:hypothetical protein
MMAAVWREPPRHQFQTLAQPLRREVVGANSDGDLVPEAVNVLGRRPPALHHPAQ